MNFHDAFIADFENGKLFWKRPAKNGAIPAGQEAGSVYRANPNGKNKDYWMIHMSGKAYKRSRVMFFMAHGRWPTPLVDHVNGDSLDDRLCNLREANYAMNTANSANKPRRHALPRGVYHNTGGRFMARISIDGKLSSLGSFATPEEARAVYVAKRKEVYGEFA